MLINTIKIRNIYEGKYKKAFFVCLLTSVKNTWLIPVFRQLFDSLKNEKIFS
jgi:hypothetical protein